MNLDTLIRPNIKALKAYSSARDEFKNFEADLVFLDANENPFGNGLNRYPDPQQMQLKRELARQKGLDINNILLGNGSDEVLDLVFRAFCEPYQDNALILPPTYGMYEVLANLNATNIKKIVLQENFQPNVDFILSVADPFSKILFLCTPNNPTGNSFEVDAVQTLLENFRGLVVLDEAYIDFSEEESWLNRLHDFPNLIITQTLSKAYALAGLRLGVCYASAEIIAVLNKIKPPYNINTLSQKKSLERLLDKESLESKVQTILRERKELIKALENISIVEQVFPTDTNFILARFDNATKRYEDLINLGIVVRNRASQPLCENCLRITVGKPDENQKLIEALNNL